MLFCNPSTKERKRTSRFKGCQCGAASLGQSTIAFSDAFARFTRLSMLTSHELFGFMSPTLAAGILEKAYESDRETYRATLAAVADAKKLRQQFFERMPRASSHTAMVAMLGKPR